MGDNEVPAYRYFQDPVTGYVQRVPADKVEQYGYDRQTWYVEVTHETAPHPEG